MKSSHQRYSTKKVFLEISLVKTGKHLCQSLFFKKENLAQMFSCEFCEISKDTFSYRTRLMADCLPCEKFLEVAI